MHLLTLYIVKNEKGLIMEFIEKAKVRLEHWISHNEHHEEEYEDFARQLENAGQDEAAGHIRKMMEFTRQGTDCLRKSVDAIKNG